jgi:hypothetical protein
MALQRSERPGLTVQFVAALLVAAAVIALVFILNAAFGVGSGPSLELVPDPAGPLPF